jgi:hypothetical protein
VLLIAALGGLAVGIGTTLGTARLIDGNDGGEGNLAGEPSSETAPSERQTPPPWIARPAARFSVTGQPNCPTAVNPARTDIRMICFEQGRFICYEERSGFWARPIPTDGVSWDACDRARAAVLDAGLLPR